MRQLIPASSRGKPDGNPKKNAANIIFAFDFTGGAASGFAPKARESHCGAVSSVD